MSHPEAKGVVVGVGGIEKEGRLIDANGVDIRGVFSEEFDGVVEGVGGAKDIMSVFLIRSWEKGSLGCRERGDLSYNKLYIISYLCLHYIIIDLLCLLL